MRKRLLAGLAAMAISLFIAHPATASPLFGDEYQGALGALHRQVEQLSEGRDAHAWGWLNPAQQAVVPRAAFVSCSTQWKGHKLLALDVKTAYPAKGYLVPGTTLVSTRSVAIVARLRFRDHSETQTFYLTHLHGKWRWTLWDTAPYAACS